MKKTIQKILFLAASMVLAACFNNTEDPQEPDVITVSGVEKEVSENDSWDLAEGEEVTLTIDGNEYKLIYHDSILILSDSETRTYFSKSEFDSSVTGTWTAYKQIKDETINILQESSENSYTIVITENNDKLKVSFELDGTVEINTNVLVEESMDTLFNEVTVNESDYSFSVEGDKANETVLDITITHAITGISTITETTVENNEDQNSLDTVTILDTLTTRDTVETLKTVDFALKHIRGAVALTSDAKYLYVANRDMGHEGVFVVDMVTEKITRVYDTGAFPPNNLTLVDSIYLVVSNTDYSEGSLSLINLETETVEKDYKDIDSDNSLSSDGGTAYLFERTLGVVTGFTNGKLIEANVVLNINTGASSNPHGIGVISDSSAYITRYNEASLLGFNPSEISGGETFEIDIEKYSAGFGTDEASPNPNMSGITVYNGTVFVVLQRLTGWSAIEESQVLMIDGESHEPEGVIDLVNKNPFASVAMGDKLFVTCTQFGFPPEGGVETVNLATGKSEGVIVSEESLGGNAVGFQPVSDNKGYAIVGGAWPLNTVKSVDY